MRTVPLVLLSALAFFALITGLILVHEWGHYITARLLGVTVEEFGFGLPPRLATVFKRKGTSFTLNWIPFGGFVRLKGENDGVEKASAGSFAKAPILARCAILVAGVAMNFLLSLCIFWFGFSAGQWIPTYLTVDDMQAASQRGEIHLVLGVGIDDVLAGGGAHEAKIPAGSLLLAVDDVNVSQPAEVVEVQKGKRSVVYTYLAPDSETPRTARVNVQDGKTGVYLRSTARELSAPTRGVIEGFLLAVREIRVVTAQTIVGMTKLFTSLASHGTVPEGVTGIVGIAHLTYASVQKGFMVYLRLVSLLSLSLAVLNILPFPALDGGRLVFVLGEIFFKPGKRRFEALVNAVGFALLLLVILLVTIYDVFRLFAK